jgi:hypothetical protein
MNRILTNPATPRGRARLPLLIVLLTVVAIGCGGSRDDRDEIRSDLGEPDDIEFTEGLYSDIEIWSYFDFNGTGMTRWYRFEKSRNSCGGDDNWSLILSGDTAPREQEGEAGSGQPSPDEGMPKPIRP